MIRSALLFFSTFVVGALIALVARAAWFSPHAERATAVAASEEYAPMVSPSPVASPTPSAPSHHHDAVPAPATTAAQGDGQPVNTLCAICGMDVDPSLPTAEYQGQTIGFGCRMCPPKFKANPDRYGPAYLRNELYEP